MARFKKLQARREVRRFLSEEFEKGTAPAEAVERLEAHLNTEEVSQKYGLDPMTILFLLRLAWMLWQWWKSEGVQRPTTTVLTSEPQWPLEEVARQFTAKSNKIDFAAEKGVDGLSLQPYKGGTRDAQCSPVTLTRNAAMTLKKNAKYAVRSINADGTVSKMHPSEHSLARTLPEAADVLARIQGLNPTKKFVVTEYKRNPSRELRQHTVRDGLRTCVYLGFSLDAKDAELRFDFTPPTGNTYSFYTTFTVETADDVYAEFNRYCIRHHGCEMIGRTSVFTV